MGLFCRTRLGSAPREPGQRPRLGFDCLAVGQAFEPGRGKPVPAVQRSEERARHRGVRVGVTAEPDHVAKPFLEPGLLGGDLQREPGREQA